MAAIDLDTVVARGNGHVETRMGDQTVMMNLDRGEYYALEQSGQRIWELMEEPVRAGAIVDQLMNEYEIDRATCEAEVLNFLNELDGNGLLAREAA